MLIMFYLRRNEKGQQNGVNYPWTVHLQKAPEAKTELPLTLPCTGVARTKVVWASGHLMGSPATTFLCPSGQATHFPI